MRTRDTARARDQRRESARRQRRLNPERFQAIELRRSFGITVADYNAMLEEQGGGCAICGRQDASQAKRRLHVDHDHATGAIRGLLCHGCNVGLGSFRDDPARLERAAEYLRLAFKVTEASAKGRAA
jgi:hypothetical protein